MILKNIFLLKELLTCGIVYHPWLLKHHQLTLLRCDYISFGLLFLFLCESANFNKLTTPALGCVCMVRCVLGFANINNSAVKLKGGGPPAPQGWGATPIHCI